MSVSATAVSDGAYYLRACDKDKAPRGRPEAGGPAAYELNAVAAGEPPGRWHGAGAERLRLAGDIVPGEASGEDFSTLVDKLVHPRTGEQLGSRPRHYASAEELVRRYRATHPDATPEQIAEERARASTTRRKAVHAYDLGYGVPKSWSVLHAALEREGRHAEAALVWEAINTGIHASLAQAAEEHGWTRRGVGGPRVAGSVTTRHERAPDWTMAIFRHHTSRDRDPQLHAHVMLLNRVQCADGKWRAIHAAALMKSKHQLDATFLRVAEAKLYELLGYRVATRPDGKAREIVGIDEAVRDLFSSRSRALTEKARELADEYEATRGIAPSAFIRWSMLQYATEQTRRPKNYAPPSRAEELARFEAQMREAVRGGLDDVVRSTDEARQRPAIAQPWDADTVIAQALADLGRRKSTWSRSHLYHAISMRLPDYLGLPAEDIPVLLTALTERALESSEAVSVNAPAVAEAPASLRDERTGRSVFDAPESFRYTTRTHLDREDSLVEELSHRGAPTVPEGTVRGLLAARHELSDEQADVAVAALGTDQRTVLIEAAAGTGKSRVMGALSDVSEQVWGRGVVGFTTAQNAAQVLAREGVERAHNIAAYLDFLDRAAEGRVSDTERATFAVPRDATVVIDEATLVDTPSAARLVAALRRAGAAKLIWIGDREQAEAVDASGAFDMLVREREPLRLHEVRRFRNRWEREASAQLRTGDVRALLEYEKRNRLHGSTDRIEVEREAVDAFVRDYQEDKQSVIVARSGEKAAELASRVRVRLVATGRVESEGVTLHDRNLAGVGDVVATRKNNRDLRVINRETWRVIGRTDRGELEVQREEGRDEHTGERRWGPTRHLPPEYVREYVELAYSGTVEAVQGRTTDTDHLLADPTMGRHRLYPGSTRGREANHIYVVLPEEGRTPLGEVADIVERDDREVAARVAIAQEQERAEHLGHLGPQWQQLVTEDRTRQHTEVVRKVLGDEEGDRVLEDPDSGGLLRLLRSAESTGREPARVLAAARGRGNLAGARSPARVLYARVDRELEREPAAHAGLTYESRVPATELGARDNAEREYAREVARAMDRRVAELGERAMDEWPDWCRHQWGERPDDPLERAELQGRVAVVAGYREQYGWDDDRDVLGPQPTRTEPERQWVWNRAADMLGLDRTSRDLSAMPEGELANRVQRWEREQQWAPPNRDEELQAAHAEHDRLRTAATFARDPDEALELEAAALAEQQRVERLEYVAQQRTDWYRHTRDARVEAEYAQAERARREEVAAAAREEEEARAEQQRGDVAGEPAPAREDAEPEIPAWARDARSQVVWERVKAAQLEGARQRAAERAERAAREREEQAARAEQERAQEPAAREEAAQLAEPERGQAELELEAPDDPVREVEPAPAAREEDDEPEPVRDSRNAEPVARDEPQDEAPQPELAEEPPARAEPEEPAQAREEPEPEPELPYEPPVDELAARRAEKEAQAAREAEAAQERERAAQAQREAEEREQAERQREEAEAAEQAAAQRAEREARDEQLRADVDRAREAARILAERRETQQREEEQRAAEAGETRDDSRDDQRVDD